MATTTDLGNLLAEEGCDRCDCGCKYWEHDRCVDCGEKWRPDMQDQADASDCDMCGGELALLGRLGRITHLRCIHCGWEQTA